MKISYVEIQNFRKLKSCRIEFGEKETIFVGANNSGKTSATDALIFFLKNKGNISTTDFTLSNWRKINEIGKEWIRISENLSNPDCSEKPNLEVRQWYPFLPSLDVWIEIDSTEVHYVLHLIPSLSWSKELLGVRLILEPENLESLYKEFVEEYQNSRHLSKTLDLWPNSLSNFIEKRLHTHFSINSYCLDPKLQNTSGDKVINPQSLLENRRSLGANPFSGLFKIDIINAQRGFSDAKSSELNNSGTSLSSQLRSYYDKHLDLSEYPCKEDINALESLETAKKIFDNNLKTHFEKPIKELEDLGYPGFTDPKISLSSSIKIQDTLNHESAVKFSILDVDEEGLFEPTSLPEKYNGLGYQNLVSMVFKLIKFRDEWMKVGKAEKKQINEDSKFERLHLVLVEEPEAHLHAQVQQVFIRKAYGVLRNHPNLKQSKELSTQMIVSTHSSHIAHESDFCNLRYFKRKPSNEKKEVPTTEVVNLSETFGTNDVTSRFATRYLKTTHCDLFFADATILVEGPAERMLVPHFIKNNFEDLKSRYITILEIGGSHAHTLRPLIEDLGIITLVITDIDSINKDAKGKIMPTRKIGLRTGNTTLKTWLPKETNLDLLLDMADDKKISKNELVRVSYQYPFKVYYNKTDEIENEVIPYTFEDALVFSNLDTFRKMTDSKGLIKKMHTALNETTALKASKEMWTALDIGSKKAEMALELFYIEEQTIEPPKYIKEGLEWLQSKLKDINTNKMMVSAHE